MLCLQAYGIIGCIRFTSGFYLLIVTRKAHMGSIRGMLPVVLQLSLCPCAARAYACVHVGAWVRAHVRACAYERARMCPYVGVACLHIPMCLFHHLFWELALC